MSSEAAEPSQTGGVSGGGPGQTGGVSGGGPGQTGGVSGGGPGQTSAVREAAGASETAANETVIAAFERRVAPARELIEHAADITDAAFSMAVRFHQGGKLLAFGIGSASTDAQHVAVEFVHPVIVGKRAFPAISLTTDIATQTAIAARVGMAEVFAHQVGKLAEPGDIALGISPDGNCPSVLAGLVAARNAGLLTVALSGCGGGAIAANGAADHLLIAGSSDRRVIKEIHVTMYHLLWELVHVFIEQPSVLGQGVVKS